MNRHRSLKGSRRATLPVVVVCLFSSVSLLIPFVGCHKAAEEQSITIGAILPLSGNGAKYGEAARKGIELAREEINSRNRIRGKMLNVVYEDSQGDPRRAVDAFRKLTSVDHVPAVIGDLFSSATLAVAPLANESKVVLLSPTSSAPELTGAGPFVFRNVASDVFEGSVMASFAQENLKIDRVAILYINNAYGLGIEKVFKTSFTERGGHIVAEEAFPEGATDFRSQLTKIRSANPEAVYIVGYRELGPLLKQAYEIGFRKQFLSTVMFEDPENLRVAGRAAEGVIYSARAYDSQSGEPAIQTFVSAFQQKYGQVPDIFAALSYDATKILALAMERNGFQPDDIRQGLLGIKNFPGVAGLTSFDKNGDVIQPAMIKIVQNGTFVRYSGKPVTGPTVVSH
jgi:branched-chain amino acid transport system substrate-binding protein